MRLERFTAEHLPHLAELFGDPEVKRFTRVPVPTPEGFDLIWFEGYEEGRRTGTREAFAILDGGSAFLGVAVAPRIDMTAQTAELGYVIAPEARGRGVATEALGLLTDWAFSTLGLVRLELVISAGNLASKRVAERCGYVYEGLMRSAYVKPGFRDDTELWSRLATDPAPG